MQGKDSKQKKQASSEKSQSPESPRKRGRPRKHPVVESDSESSHSAGDIIEYKWSQVLSIRYR